MRGTKWSNETTLKAYKIQLACGSSGYDVVKELGQLLPSQRTLQRRSFKCDEDESQDDGGGRKALCYLELTKWPSRPNWI
jgi:hypothetical protein